MYTPRRLLGPTVLAPGASAVLSTVPVGSTDILKQLVAANTLDAPTKLFVSLVPSGLVSVIDNRLIPGSIVEPKSVVTFNFSQVLNSGDSIAGRADVANLLSANNASFETSVSGWSPRANTAIARSTVQAAHGVASMRVSSTTTTTITLAVDSVLIPVNKGKLYTAKASYRADGTARSCRLLIQWYREDSAYIGQTNSPPLTNFTTAFREMIVSGVPPAEASSARVLVAIDGVAVQNEGHFVDKAQLSEGDATVPWVDPSNSGLVLTGSGVRFS